MVLRSRGAICLLPFSLRRYVHEERSLLVLLLCVGLFALGCPQQPKNEAKAVHRRCGKARRNGTSLRPNRATCRNRLRR